MRKQAKREGKRRKRKGMKEEGKEGNKNKKRFGKSVDKGMWDWYTNKAESDKRQSETAQKARRRGRRRTLKTV